MQIIDTHCHIHDDEYSLDRTQALEDAHAAGVSPLLVIGTSVKFSEQAVLFAQKSGREVYALVAIHPHDAAKPGEKMVNIRRLIEKDRARSERVIVGVGECGLDYWYENSDRQSQKTVFMQHLELAAEFDMPLSLHIRGEREDQRQAVLDAVELISEAESRFEYSFRGVVHSFSAYKEELEILLERNFYIGVNGIATFSKDQKQIEMFAAIPQDRLLFETDAPYLTPSPIRGKINEPKNIAHTVSFMATLMKTTEQQLAKVSTENAKKLFGI